MAYANASDADDAVAAGTPASGGAPRTPTRAKTCAAALVSPKHVLTAHHCVYNATGKRNRAPASLVFFPAPGAGCGGGGEGASPGAPVRAVALRALPEFEGCLEDMAGDPTKAIERATK